MSPAEKTCSCGKSSKACGRRSKSSAEIESIRLEAHARAVAVIRCCQQPMDADELRTNLLCLAFAIKALTEDAP